MEPPRHEPIPERLAHVVRTATFFNQHGNLEWAEVLGGLALAITWGLWLLLPIGTFAASRSYVTMEQLAPSWVWGLIFLTVGINEILAVAFGGKTLRRVAALFGLGAWTFIAATFWVANPESTGAPLYTIITIMAFNICWRLWV